MNGFYGFFRYLRVMRLNGLASEGRKRAGGKFMALVVKARREKGKNRSRTTHFNDVV
jgi:hypothetical protein